MLKNVEFLNQKMEMLRKNKASHCKNENVWYPQGHLVTWFSIYALNNSNSLQFSKKHLKLNQKKEMLKMSTGSKMKDLFSIGY